MTDRADLPRRRVFRSLCCGAGLALTAAGTPTLAGLVTSSGVKR